MKKKIQLFGVLLIMITFTWSLMQNEKKIVWLSVENNLFTLSLKDNAGDETVYPWYNADEDMYYFFLPAYTKENIVYFADEEIKIYYKDELIGDNKLNWEDGKVYRLKINHTDEYNIKFMKSENLPTLYIETSSGKMEHIHEDKENEETGNIKIINSEGYAEYRGELSKISGRGNSTWSYEKKPYAIELAHAEGLCGMNCSTKWNLLALWNENTKISTKLVLDLANEMGMNYSPQGEWVDLYLNGNYEGLYLLTGSVSVGKGRVEITDLEKKNKLLNPLIEEAAYIDNVSFKGYELNNGENNITGGYLIEKQWSGFYEEEKCGFTTKQNHNFSFKSPQHPSTEQVKYMKEFCQKVEDSIICGNYEKYIDVESFIDKYLIEEISLNYDANIGSAFFYKDADKDILYAGPVWDYDCAFGRMNQDFLDGKYLDYEWTILIPRLSNGDVLSWFAYLYEDESFYEKMCQRYSEILPYLEELVNTGIDDYVEWIQASVNMNSARWPQNISGYYLEYYNNVKYLKFFLTNRLKYLCQRWNISYNGIDVQANDEIHQVFFIKENKLVETILVKDGEFIFTLPEFDHSIYKGWYFKEQGMYRDKIPIYEDIVLYAKTYTE